MHKMMLSNQSISLLSLNGHTWAILRCIVLIFARQIKNIIIIDFGYWKSPMICYNTLLQLLDQVEC